MEQIAKLLEALKIPVKVILPALCIFSGLLIFLSDKALTKLGLLAWKNEHCFVLGIVFLISACLIFVYILWFLKDKIWGIIQENTLYYRTARKIGKLSDAENAILISLYNDPTYTKTIDCGHPVVQGLLAQQYIHMGGTQLLSADRRTGTVAGKCTLQPLVYRTFNHYKPVLERRIKKTESKLAKTNNVVKSQKLQAQLDDLLEKYHVIYERGLEN